LDVACGTGYWGFRIATSKEGHPYLLGLDIWRDYLKKLRRVRIYDDLMLADVRQLPFREEVFDLVIACEVLEHLPKPEGFSLLEDLLRICQGRVIVSTPLGLLKQRDEENPYQEHLSGWHVQDFTARGFNFMLVEYPLPRTLRAADRIRRIIFRLREAFKEIVAWKDCREGNVKCGKRVAG